jgi:GNAT superfamily N-acetyltransferase
MADYFNRRYHPGQALSPRAGYIAVADDTVIGYIAGHRTTRLGCEGEVEYLYVAPSHRGHGVATVLLRRLAEWFTSNGARTVCVDVNPDSAAALRFYQSTGATQRKGPWYAWKDIGTLLG